MSSATRILIVEDVPHDATLAEHEILKTIPSAEFRRVETRNDFISALEDFQPDLIISDYQMPTFDGMSALKIAISLCPLTPFIIHTGSLNEDTAVECMKAGATDYVIKEQLRRLGPAIKQALENKKIKLENIKAQEALIESEKRFRRLAENADDIIFRYELIPEFRFTYVSPSVTQLTGYKPDDLYADPDLWQKIINPEDIILIKNQLSSRPGNCITTLLKWIRKDGEIIWIEQKNVPVYDLDGNLLAFEGIARNITERIRSEEKLKANFSLLKMAGESARFGGWSANLAEKRVLWSDVVAAIHGKPAGFSPGLDEAFNYYAPEWRERKILAFKRCSEEGIPYDEEMEIITKGGKRRWVRVIGEAVRDENGIINEVHGSFQDISKIKNAEQNLEQSRQALTRLIGNLSGVVYRCRHDREWTMEYISNGCMELTGYNAREFYKKEINWGRLIHEDDFDKVWNEISESIRQKVPFQIEYRIRNSNGRKKWVWEKGCGVYDDNGIIVAIEGFIADITERRETEDALRDSMKNYRELIDGMNETVWVIDFNGELIDVNKTAISNLGYTKNELFSIGLNGIDTSMKPEDILSLIKSLPEDKIQIFETTHRTKNGRVFPVEVNSSIVTFLGEKAVLSIARDISRRKRDESIQQILYDIARTSTSISAVDELLSVVRKELSKVIDTTDFSVALFNPDNNNLQIVDTENEKYDIHSWNIDESPAGYVFKTGKTLYLNKKEWKSFIKNRKLPASETEAVCWLGVPLIVDQNAIGVLVVRSNNEDNAYDDNSARLMEMVAHELAIVFQRNRIILDLIKAKEKAEESDRLKTAFLANVSHEIRTPMNGILGFLDLLRNPDYDSDQKDEFIDLVNISGQRLLDTINNIMEISKIESGQIEVHDSETNLMEVMKYHFDFFRQQAGEKGLSLRLASHLTGDAAVVKIDKFKINGILTNLLNNALKFTHEGGVEFGNYLERDLIIFFVKDSGIGIAEKKIDAVFERFVQADLNLSRPYEGIGLGLSIVKAYIDSLGGKIWVSSEVAKGSTFFFSIPYNPLRHEAAAGGAADSLPTEIKRSLKILVAEDDEISYRYLNTILKNQSITLLHARNGMEAMDAVRKNPDISLILMDIRMPDMNGLEATRQIRLFNKTIPIIAQTAHAYHEDKDKATAAGCDDYISKPINKTLLLEIIQKFT